ncbi:hypothetical protein J1605_010764 [Eschrichtius robustus]|uniref:Uncharacterized protein n=1 Tax=Eschrichtius robustus TaxID=9764 RepID=A0AB34GT42_ESCRO|nr:hypothetical protein J1605_010764 [Eschrichtius robustus]
MLSRELPTRRSKKKHQEEKPLCEKRKQVLSPFCEKDLELLRPQCRVSSDPHHHPLGPMEQAAACHTRRLKGYAEPLENKSKTLKRC